MPKVHHVKRAAKDYPKQGIRKGTEYWWFETKRNGRFTGKIRYKNKPRRSQLTGSEYFRELYGIQEALEDAAAEFATAEFGGDEHASAEDVRDALQAFETAVETAAASMRELAERTREKHDNLPDSLRNADNGKLLDRRADGCNSVADQLEVLHGEIGATDVEEVNADFAAEKLGEIDWSEAEE